MLDRGSILVTGGAGFIGSAIVWELNHRGLDNILIADVLDESDKWKNLAPLRFRDYMQAETLLRLVESDSPRLADVKTVFHLGACSSTTETDGAYLIRNNFEYTKTLAEWAIRRDARFVYASSAATYGALEQDLTESRDPHSLRPLNMYGYSKHIFDLHALANGYTDHLTGLKYFNVFGPNENHKAGMRSMVHRAFHQIQDTKVVRLFKSYRPEFADGEQCRDFLYVKDAVKMTLHLAEHNHRGIFNVGSGIAHTWLDLAHAVFAAMNLPPAIEFIEMPESLRPRYQYFTQARMDRFRNTGYRDEITPLADAVADYVRNYLAPGLYLGDERAR